MKTFKETMGKDFGDPDQPAPKQLFYETFAAGFSDQLPTLKQAEQLLIDLAMGRSEGNQGIAAGILGISRQALNKRLLLHKDRISED